MTTDTFDYRTSQEAFTSLDGRWAATMSEVENKCKEGGAYSQFCSLFLKLQQQEKELVGPELLWHRRMQFLRQCQKLLPANDLNIGIAQVRIENVLMPLQAKLIRAIVAQELE